MRLPVLSALLIAGAIAGFASGTRHVLDRHHSCRSHGAFAAAHCGACPDTIDSHGDRGAAHR